jgi:hypothetical protein
MVENGHRVENSSYAAMMRRMVAAHGRRAGYDVEALVDLVELRVMLDQTLTEAVHHLRSEAGGAYSWAEIGDRLGVSAQAAQQRFRGPGARKVGGQPAGLR